MNNNVIVTENKQKNFQLQLQLLTLENFQLQLQENRVINSNFVNCNYNFSKPGTKPICTCEKTPCIVLQETIELLVPVCAECKIVSE